MDPRIRRTRQLLQAALQRLLETKSFESISVAEIADEATLNRATFYDHFSDKTALLEGLVSARFQALLEQRKVVFDGGYAEAITGIIQAMCEYLTGLPTTECAAHRRLETHFESALMSVVRGMLLAGMERSEGKMAVAPELLAATISGAIYGGASEWARTAERVPVEEAVRVIFWLIRPMVDSHPSTD